MSKHETQATKILKLLKQKGQMYNYELSKICLQYTGRIYNLRHQWGEPIECEYIKPGVFLYTYHGERAKRWWEL